MRCSKIHGGVARAGVRRGVKYVLARAALSIKKGANIEVKRVKIVDAKFGWPEI